MRRVDQSGRPWPARVRSRSIGLSLVSAMVIVACNQVSEIESKRQVHTPPAASTATLVALGPAARLFDREVAKLPEMYRIAHRRAGDPSAFPLHGLWVAHNQRHAVAVGNFGTVLRLDGEDPAKPGKWQVDQRASTLTANPWRSVSLASDGSWGLAVGDRGTILELGLDFARLLPGPKLELELNFDSLWVEPYGQHAWLSARLPHGGTTLIRYLRNANDNNSSWKIAQEIPHLYRSRFIEYAPDAGSSQELGTSGTFDNPGLVGLIDCHDADPHPADELEPRIHDQFYALKRSGQWQAVGDGCSADSVDATEAIRPLASLDWRLSDTSHASIESRDAAGGWQPIACSPIVVNFGDVERPVEIDFEELMKSGGGYHYSLSIVLDPATTHEQLDRISTAIGQKFLHEDSGYYADFSTSFRLRSSYLHFGRITNGSSGLSRVENLLPKGSLLQRAKSVFTENEWWLLTEDNLAHCPGPAPHVTTEGDILHLRYSTNARFQTVGCAIALATIAYGLVGGVDRLEIEIRRRSRITLNLKFTRKIFGRLDGVADIVDRRDQQLHELEHRWKLRKVGSSREERGVFPVYHDQLEQLVASQLR